MNTSTGSYPRDKAWRKALQPCSDLIEKNSNYDLDIIFKGLDDVIMELGQKAMRNSEKERNANAMNDIKEEVMDFVNERDWDQFHSPENLAKSICIEAGELLECFQWNSDFDRAAVCEELADVATYCIMMADKLDVELEDIIREKLEKTKAKYPVEKAKGVSTKYDKL